MSENKYPDHIYVIADAIAVWWPQDSGVGVDYCDVAVDVDKALRHWAALRNPLPAIDGVQQWCQKLKEVQAELLVVMTMPTDTDRNTMERTKAAVKIYEKLETLKDAVRPPDGLRIPEEATQEFMDTTKRLLVHVFGVSEGDIKADLRP